MSVSTTNGHEIKKPTGDLAKIIKLIGDGSSADVLQASELLCALSADELRWIFERGNLDPATGWIRLPSLKHLKEKECRGRPQLRMVTAAMKIDPSMMEFLSSIASLAVNSSPGDWTMHGPYTPDDSGTCLLIETEAGPSDGDRTPPDFTSLASLPALPNVSSVQISGMESFSFEGAENFPKLKRLQLLGVNHLDDIGSLGKCPGLETLLIKVPLSEFKPLGSMPSVRHLSLGCDLTENHPLQSLEGLEIFPGLEHLQSGGVTDITPLLRYAAERNVSVSCSEWMGMNTTLTFEFQPKA